MIAPRRALIAALATLTSGEMYAQSPGGPPLGKRELVGIVKDIRGAGVEGATVDVLGLTARTDAKGLFRLFTPELDTATIAIRRPGFSPIEALISARGRQWDTVMVEMEPMTNLSVVRVEEEQQLKRQGMRGFEERAKQKGNGLYIRREEIVQRNSLLLSDVLQTRRGVQLVRLGARRYGVRFPNYTASLNNSAANRGMSCAPDMWIDGQRVRGMEIDDIPANTVEAMEIYDSFASLPMEFSLSANSVPCGTIVLWTRQPGTKKP